MSKSEKTTGSRLEGAGVWIGAAAAIVFAVMASNPAMAQGIAGSKHNLGTGGTGAVHATGATDTSEICVFCHTPHGGQVGTAPLWNKNLPSTTYQLYGSTGGESATKDGTVLVVGSVSQACLSCHDGTQALDNMVNKPGSGGWNSGGVSAAYTMTGSGTGNVMPTGVTALGSDLRNDHPIGIEYCGGGIGNDGSGTCRDPDFVAPTYSATLNAFWVDTTSTTLSTVSGTANAREKTDMILYRRNDSGAAGPYVECGSCHDPHNAANGTFLRRSNGGSAVCLSCHVK